MKRFVRMVGVVACAPLLLTLVPGTAVAAKPVQPVEHYSVPYGPFPAEECGVPITVTGTQEGTFSVRPAKGSGGHAFYAHDNYTFTETLTGPGGSVTLVARGAFRESNAELVEGTVFRFTGKDSGVWTFYDSAGEVVLRYAGLFSFTEDFDTFEDEDGDGVADLVPGGTPVENTWTLLRDKRAWPRGGDHCEVMVELLT